MIPSETTTVGFRARGAAVARWCRAWRGGAEGKDRSCERNDSVGRGPRARVRGCGEVARGNGGAARCRRARGGGRPGKRHRRCALRALGHGRFRPARRRDRRGHRGSACGLAGHRRDRRRRRVRGRHRRRRMRAYHDRRLPARRCRRCSEVRDRGRRGRRRQAGLGGVVCRPDEGGLQHPRRRRGGPCGRRGRGSGRCAHRRRRRLFGRLRRAGGARLPSSARGHHRHGQRAGAALRGARSRQDPQLQQLRHGRLRPRGRCRGRDAAHRSGHLRGPARRRGTGGPRVRLRRHYGRGCQRRLRLHQARGGRARRAYDDHGEHPPRQGPDLRHGGGHARLRTARQPGGGLRGLPAAHPPRAAHHAGLSLHGPSRGEGAPYRRREEPRSAPHLSAGEPDAHRRGL